MGARTWWPKATAGQLQHLLGIDSDRPWVEYAACRETDPEIFYPLKGESTRPAKAICARCSVRDACRDAALASGERWGIHGGLSERERLAMRGEVA